MTKLDLMTLAGPIFPAKSERLELIDLLKEQMFADYQKPDRPSITKSILDRVVADLEHAVLLLDELQKVQDKLFSKEQQERLAASRPATQVVDREAVEHALIETLPGVGKPSNKSVRDIAVDRVLSLLRPAEPVEAERSDTVAQRVWFDGENIRTKNLTADDIYQKPTTTDAVGEPVAWSASTHDEIIKRLMANVGIPNSQSLYSAFKQFANELHYLSIKESHPKSPDTSAAVLQRVALEQALNSLAEIASSHIPDCPAHYAGEELAWAQRHVGCLRQKAEIARDGIAAAIRQLPTSKD